MEENSQDLIPWYRKANLAGAARVGPDDRGLETQHLRAVSLEDQDKEGNWRTFAGWQTTSCATDFP